jgi:hypothetical protein
MGRLARYSQHPTSKITPVPPIAYRVDTSFVIIFSTRMTRPGRMPKGRQGCSRIFYPPGDEQTLKASTMKID